MFPKRDKVIAEADIICVILVVVTITTAMAISRNVGSRSPSFDVGGFRSRMETLPHFKPRKSQFAKTRSIAICIQK